MTAPVEIEIQRLPHAPELLPAYKTQGAVGMDLEAAIDSPITLNPLDRALIPTGWIIALPEGYEAQIRARSGLAIKHGITVINGVGTIDWDYRDEVKVGLVNVSKETYTLMPGDRVAQMVIAPVTRGQWHEVPEVSLALASVRAGGFGSTGR